MIILRVGCEMAMKIVHGYIKCILDALLVTNAELNDSQIINNIKYNKESLYMFSKILI